MADTAVRGAYRFGPFQLDVRERRLSRGDDVIPLRLKVFDTLLRAGRECRPAGHQAGTARHGVARDDGRGKQPESQRVGAAEGARGEERRVSSTSRPCRAWVIASSHRSNAAVPQTDVLASSAAKARQEIRYCTTSDGVRLAYATTGNGPPLVKASNWLTHLDFEWGSPIWRHWYAAALTSSSGRSLRRARQWHVSARRGSM